MLPATVSHGNRAASWNITPVLPLTSTVPDGGLVEVGDQVEQGRLTAPRSADQADELARLYVEMDAVQGEHRAGSPAVSLGHSVEVDMSTGDL